MREGERKRNQNKNKKIDTGVTEWHQSSQTRISEIFNAAILQNKTMMLIIINTNIIRLVLLTLKQQRWSNEKSFYLSRPQTRVAQNLLNVPILVDQSAQTAISSAVEKAVVG